MSTAETEVDDLISHLSRGLHPADRDAFRRAAESALATPQCWGPGLTHRTVTAIWRNYFHPPTVEPRTTTWESDRRTASKLVSKPAVGGRPVRRIG